MAARKKSTKRATKKVARKRAETPPESCFVIMPFGGWLDDYYSDIYCSAIEESGLNPQRADDLFRPSTIINDIWDYTKKAKVLLADLTGKNPNVFYELGLAHAIAKPVILIAESMEDIPFDLRALRVILYDKNAPNWGEILRQKIVASLKEVLSAPAEAVLPTFLNVKGLGAKTSVSQDQLDLIEIKQDLDMLRREIRTQQSRSTHIDAVEAKSLLRTLVSHGSSDEDVLRRLSRLGAPEDWIRDELKRERDSVERRRRLIAQRLHDQREKAQAGPGHGTKDA
ncbi:hypothetical protein [Lysobacter soyae]|uniref:Uncharacterized protein n=1 Tax=Lysobacter soyae TaxID=2764185 RepID=A0ABX8WQI5_9GAMM|nr:hypothetical protein [Lysobacter sp. CJ11]QYR52957.1 hypothetical protein H8L67_00045 [Lysobacter sp. CJ11]